MSGAPFSRRTLVGGALSTGLMAAVPDMARAQATKSLPVLNVLNSRGNSTVTIQELIKRQGYLGQLGVQANDHYVVDGSRILASLLSGENDVCILSGITTALSAIQKGAEIKIIAGALVKPEHAVYTSKKDIRTLADLKGRAIGTGSIGSLLQEMMVALFQKYGVDYSDVRFVNVGSSSDVFKAVVAGTVDAGVSEIDVYNQQAKYGVHVIKEGDLWKELPNFFFQATFASDKAIREKRDALVRLLAAYAKLWRFLSTPNSKDAYVAAQEAALGRKNEEAAAWQWQFFRDAHIYATDLLIPQSSLDYLQKLNVAVGMQKTALPFDTVTDMSLARDAVKMLG